MSAAKRSFPPGVVVSDAVVLACISQGQTEAVRELYDRYAPMLLSFARRIDPQEAEDIVQTVFLRTLHLAAKFDARTPSARAWLYAITARVAMERRRSMRRLHMALTRLATQALPSAEPVIDVRRDLRAGLARLSTAKRTVLVLAEVEGFSCEEIAAMLDVPIGTVWTRLHHARRELRSYQDGEP
jgi:RNA polymerase sigma factor (sigma-70 family)